MLTKLNIRSRVLVVLLGLLINNGFAKTSPKPSFSLFPNDSLELLIVDTTSTDSLKFNDVSKNAPEFKVKYTAKDSIDFDNTNQIVYLFGEAKVEYGEISLSAHLIKVYISKNEVHAFGERDANGKLINKVVFNDKGEEFQSPEMKYNFTSKKGTIIQATTQEGEMYLLSDRGKKMPNNEIFLKTGKITTCDAEHPHFYFEATKLKIVPGKKIIVGPTNLVIRELRTPVWVPFGMFPNNTKRKTGILIPGYGQRDGSFGLDQLGFHWAINDYVHADFLSNIYFSGTTLLSADFKYKKRYKYRGNLKIDYNSIVKGIKGIENTSNLKHSIKRDFKIKWSFMQDSKAHPKSSLKINIDAKSPTFNQTQNLNSTTAVSSVQGQNTSQVSWGWNEKNWSITSTSRLDQNFSQNRVSMTLPSLNLSIRPVKKGIFTFGGSAEGKNSVTAPDSTFFKKSTLNNLRNGAKANFNVRVSKRVSLFKYLNITLPSINWNSYLMTEEIYKIQAESGLSNDTINKYNYAYDLSLGNVGLNTKVFGTYKLKKGMYIEGFRHTITPSVNLTYRPDFFIDAQNINQFEYDTVSQKNIEYNKYSTSIFRPNASKAASLNFSLDQNLQSKVRDNADSTGLKYKKVNIINAFRVNSSYNILKDSLKWSNLNFSLNTAPVFLKNLNISGNFSPYDIDEDGFVYDSLLWKAGKLGRLTSFRAQSTISLNRNQFVKWIFGLDKGKDQDFGWSMNINYTYTYSKPTFDVSTNQSLGLSGKVDLSDNLSFRYNLPINMKTYDFAQNGYLNFTRALHCWEMTTNWFPFRDDVWFTFTIRPKAGLLQDLKYDRKRQGRD